MEKLKEYFFLTSLAGPAAAYRVKQEARQFLATWCLGQRGVAVRGASLIGWPARTDSERLYLCLSRTHGALHEGARETETAFWSLRPTAGFWQSMVSGRYNYHVVWLRNGSR